MAKPKCKYPHKDKLSKLEAQTRAAVLSRQQQIWISAYRCPSGDHWHVGHALKRNGTRRKRKRW